MELTLTEINETLDKLEKSPIYFEKKFTIEEAREYLGKEYIEKFNINDENVQFMAEFHSEELYLSDRDFLIRCYSILKEEKEKEQKIEVARYRLKIMGIEV